MGYQFQSVASVGPLLVPELGLAWAQLGTLIGVYMLPGAFFALPGGMLGQRLGERRTVVASLALMVAGGLVTAASHGFALAVSGRLLSGVGAVLMNILLAKMVADWFAEGELTTAMAVMLSSWPVGLGLAAATLGGVATASSWRMAVATTAVAAALGLVLIAFAYRDPPRAQGSAAGPPARRARLPRREVRLALSAGFAWSCFNASLVAVIAFGPAMLVARGVSLGDAGFIVRLATAFGVYYTVFYVVMALTQLAAGVVRDVVGSPAAPIVFAALVMAATVLGLALFRLAERAAPRPDASAPRVARCP